MKVRFKIQLREKMGIEGAFNSKPNYVDLVNLIRIRKKAANTKNPIGKVYGEKNRHYFSAGAD